MKHIRTHVLHFTFLVTLLVAVAGLSACGGGGSTTTPTGSGVSGSGS